MNLFPRSPDLANPSRKQLSENPLFSLLAKSEIRGGSVLCTPFHLSHLLKQKSHKRKLLFYTNASQKIGF